MPAGSDDEHTDQAGTSSEDDWDGESELPEEGEEWRFPLDELGDEETGDDRSGNVTGTINPRGPLEPGDVDLENAVFFLVGALGTILFVVLAVAGL